MFVRVVGNIKYTVVSHCSTLVTNLNVYKIEIKSNEVFNFIVPAFGVQFPVTACLIKKICTIDIKKNKIRHLTGDLAQNNIQDYR